MLPQVAGTEVWLCGCLAPPGRWDPTPVTVPPTQDLLTYGHWSLAPLLFWSFLDPEHPPGSQGLALPLSLSPAFRNFLCPQT